MSPNRGHQDFVTPPNQLFSSLVLLFERQFWLPLPNPQFPSSRKPARTFSSEIIEIRNETCKRQKRELDEEENTVCWWSLLLLVTCPPLLHTDTDVFSQQGHPGCTRALKKHDISKIRCETQTRSISQGESELQQASECWERSPRCRSSPEALQVLGR